METGCSCAADRHHAAVRAHDVHFAGEISRGADGSRAAADRSRTRGPTKALSAVVEVRSYSRNSRRISCDKRNEHDPGWRGAASRRRGARAPDWHRNAGNKPRPLRLPASRKLCRQCLRPAASSSVVSTSPLAFEPLVDLERHVARGQRPRPMKEQIEGLDAVAPPDRIDIAKALRRDQRGRAPLRSSTVLMAIVEPCSTSAKPAWSQSARRRLSATPRVGSAGTVDVFDVTSSPSMTADEIGERAANIDTDDIHSCSTLSPSVQCRHRVNRRSAMRTQPLNAIAIAARRATKANSGAGSKFSANMGVKWPMPVGRHVKFGQDHAEQRHRHGTAAARRKGWRPYPEIHVSRRCRA